MAIASFGRHTDGEFLVVALLPMRRKFRRKDPCRRQLTVTATRPVPRYRLATWPEIGRITMHGCR
jgi:hypothetical protein